MTDINPELFETYFNTRYSKSKNRTWQTTDGMLIQLYYPIGSLSAESKQQFQQNILSLIKQDGSHVVSGAYTYNNIFDRPANLYIIVRNVEKNALELVLNFSPNQQVICIGSRSPSQPVLQLFREIVALPQPQFIFVSGKQLIESLSQLKHDDIAHNIVFQLEQLNHDLLLNSNVEITIINKENINKPSIVTHIRELHQYTMSDAALKQHLLKNPHVLAYVNGQIAGSARTNSLFDKFAVIGGVLTKKEYRKLGVGTSVSYFIVRILQSLTEQVVLETDTKNIPALKIYRKLGFKEVGVSMFMDRGFQRIKEIFGDRDY